MNRKVVLTIGGSDPSCGAGVQGDVRTIIAHGCTPLSAVTALTCQSEEEVLSVHGVGRDFLLSQLDSLFASTKIHAVKLGMLYDESIIEGLTEFFEPLKESIPIVLDTVLRSSSGMELLSLEGIFALNRKLIPIASLATPNIPEAELITGVTIQSEDDMARAAALLLANGAKAALIKGGHLPGSSYASDLLLTSYGYEWFRSERVWGEDLHGTGCAFSSSIACRLAFGDRLSDAVRTAKFFITEAIRSSKNLGFKSVDHFWQRRERFRTFFASSQKAEEALQL